MDMDMAMAIEWKSYRKRQCRKSSQKDNGYDYRYIHI